MTRDGRLATSITVSGRVVHGDHRGRTIGFPTANVLLKETDLPDFGVYAGTLNGMPAAISVGVRPTFGSGLRPLLEAHVIGFSGDLYNQVVTVTLVERVRDELAFDSTEELAAHIRTDITAIANILRAIEP